jgi:hypothetical protein
MLAVGLWTTQISALPSNVADVTSGDPQALDKMAWLVRNMDAVLRHQADTDSELVALKEEAKVRSLAEARLEATVQTVGRRVSGLERALLQAHTKLHSMELKLNATSVPRFPSRLCISSKQMNVADARASLRHPRPTVAGRIAGDCRQQGFAKQARLLGRAWTAWKASWWALAPSSSICGAS